MTYSCEVISQVVAEPSDWAGLDWITADNMHVAHRCINIWCVCCLLPQPWNSFKPDLVSRPPLPPTTNLLQCPHNLPGTSSGSSQGPRVDPCLFDKIPQGLLKIYRLHHLALWTCGSSSQHQHGAMEQRLHRTTTCSIAVRWWTNSTQDLLSCLRHKIFSNCFICWSSSGTNGCRASVLSIIPNGSAKWTARDSRGV